MSMMFFLLNILLQHVSKEAVRLKEKNIVSEILAVTLGPAGVQVRVR
jgi:hypothetical protein